jgi:putative membrane-bound dehydrogenase-like protein
MIVHPRRTLLAVSLLFGVVASAHAQKEFGFDNRKPSGQPYLKPEESVARMKVADGFEVKLFAAEPMVVNPIAMTVDEKGRVWVIECFEYPKRTAKGMMPRDRIVILEDTKGTGVADKRTVFAEGKDFPVPFDLASGLEVGNGGVYVGAPPYLFFIENKNDKPGKFEILLKGFGSQDTHETLNTFQWGPDGRLYGLHGVFTSSDVSPGQADGPATRLNAGVWRYDTRAKKFEVFAEGTSNPWGMDWRNTDGQFILCCCVIPHLFHIVPGGVYKRQAGQSFNPYVYSYLNEICDHTFHKESGWAHAGLISLDTPLMPEKYRNSVIFGSIHGCSIKQNILKKNGSTFTASRGDDFLVSGDKNFRPINLRWGPNGEIYCIDWHDQNPCHQAAPDSWDYEHGRVYRIQPKGLKTKKAEDLGQKSFADLVQIVERPVPDDENPYRYRTALRLIAERTQRAAEKLPKELGRGNNHSRKTRQVWTDCATGATNQQGPIYDLGIAWTGSSDEALAWQIRATGDSSQPTNNHVRELEHIASGGRLTSRPASVRAELASAAIRLGRTEDTRNLVHLLFEFNEDAADPVIPDLLWIAYEQQLTKGVKEELRWLTEHAANPRLPEQQRLRSRNLLLIETIVPRTMRRLVATGKKEDLDACIGFVDDQIDVTVKRKALEGLAIALKGRQVDAPDQWKRSYPYLAKEGDAEVRRLVQILAIIFRDRAAANAALAVARDTSKPLPERSAAVRDLGVARIDEAKRPLLDMLQSEKDAALRQEVCRALAGYDGGDVPAEVLKSWKDYPPGVRVEAVNLLAGRKEWAIELLKAVGDKRVARTDLTDNTILRMNAFKDRDIDARIKAVWGQVRSTPAELTKLIDEMRTELYAGPASFERGRKVFDNQCAKCHKFEGRGSSVGPELDGAGRDIEYLLVNVLDPNRVVGAPYFQRVATMKNGQVHVGLLAAEDGNTLTLKSENDALRVLAKKDIDTVEVVEKSMMPEGLDKNMTKQDFRDLVRYVMAHPFITDVEIDGPYLDTSPAVFIDRPEPVPGAKWRPVSAGTPGRIALPAAKRGVVYVKATFTAPEDMQTRLLLGGGVVSAWINTKQVPLGAPGAGPAAADQAGVDVSLVKGENRLILRVEYQGDREAVYVRLLDPNRKIHYPEPKNK